MDAGHFVRAAATDKTIRGKRNDTYPIEVWYFIASFVFLVAIFQHGSWVVSKFTRRRGSPTASGRLDTEAGVAAYKQSYSLRRLPSAIANVYRVAAFRWTLQIGSSYTLNMAEVFVTCAYIIAVFIWEFAFTTDLEGQKLDITYWGNRAGDIAALQFPLITALGTKNNVVSYITGISADKLNYVHRMTARVMFVLLWVHGGAKLSTLEPDQKVGYLVPCGLAAMAAFSVLIVVSLRPIRARAYELFFVTHFLMVMVFLIGGYYHVDFEGVPYYMWPCFLVWGLDRFIRGVRMVAYNHLYFSFSASKHNLDGSLEQLSPHFVRLRVWRPPHFRWNAGQTAYITMPGVSRFPWEAHPFTIASIDDGGRTGDEKEQEKNSGLEDVPAGWKELVFLINVRDGFTKRLARAAEKGDRVAVLIDGPYGFTPGLEGDDTTVLVAGGSGVSYTLATFLSIVQAARKGTSACRKVVFIWTVRDPSHIEWAARSLAGALEAAPPHLTISIRIFVTAGPAKAPNALADDAGSVLSAASRYSSPTVRSDAPILLNFPMVEVTHGRPDLVRLLREEASVNTGLMSVTVCGSQAIARACRSALSLPVSGPAKVLRGGPSVVLHVESFGYA
ncbi:iron reductase [Amylocystis lapponica]|nr:iron reductase [Amylocystis lapponica]